MNIRTRVLGTAGIFGLLVLALGLGTVPSQEDPALNGATEDTFDPDQYPAHTLSDILSRNPCSGTQIYEIKDVLFRDELVFDDDLRSVSSDRFDLLKRWAVSLNAPDRAADFAQEIRVHEAGEGRWIVVSKTIENYIKKDLKAGDKVLFFMSYVGCASGRPLFAVEEYSTPNYEDLEEGADSYVA